MKKIITLLLCLLMILSLPACGNNHTTTEEPKTDSTETSASTENEEATPAEEDTQSFDTSWASNSFEALLPKLPFTGWTITEETDSFCKMEVGDLKTNTSTGVDADAADKIALIDYLDSLTAYGFTVEETGEGYEWLVTDAAGNTAEFMCGDSFCFLTITKANS